MLSNDPRSLSVLLAYEAGYLRAKQCCRLLGLDPDAGAIREMLRLRRLVLQTVLGGALPPLANCGCQTIGTEATTSQARTA